MSDAWSPPAAIDLEAVFPLDPVERVMFEQITARVARIDDDQLRPLLARILTRLKGLEVRHNAPPELAFAVWVPRKSDRYLMATFPGWLERYVFSAIRCLRSWPCTICLGAILEGSMYYRADQVRTQKLRDVKICWACGERLSPSRGLQVAKAPDIS